MTLYIAAGLILAVLGAGYWLYRKGRAAERGDMTEKIAGIKDEQLKVDRPSRDDVVDRLRRGGF